jgi:hypothetical protein
VSKTVYSNSGRDADAAVDEILHKRGLNNVESCFILLGLNLGDEKYKEIEEKLPQLAAVVWEQIYEKGLERKMACSTLSK